ncbi:tetrahydromethanopterin S-methyltransferase subunit D [Methanolapillus ohkumae]|uniref:Tetrahydromethanopterin S-methyltransferase subunit D n=1 Tax=Methanolapillus ohkumae TaxID=3028298 RepID=A0AA96V8D5_9EURY|nr:hypothetical protein MsAm2_15370 [Methanosarcinaceae archaeon Am2]
MIATEIGYVYYLIDDFFELLWPVIFIAAGGVLISLSVHFIPVGGAPAAMAQATGVGTGTTQLAAGAGLTGLLIAAAVSLQTHDFGLVLFLGAIGSTIMIAVVMLMANTVYIYGVGCPPASGKSAKDPITKDRQDIYVSKGTEGHGIPTVCFISGLIGGFLGGLGGSLIFEILFTLCGGMLVLPVTAASVAIMLSIALFFINAVIASYNISGTIEGFHDPKFKKWKKAALVSAIMTFVFGFLCVLVIQFIGGGIWF